MMGEKIGDGQRRVLLSYSDKYESFGLMQV
jgi:hypothetical protein